MSGLPEAHRTSAWEVSSFNGAHTGRLARGVSRLEALVTSSPCDSEANTRKGLLSEHDISLRFRKTYATE